MHRPIENRESRAVSQPSVAKSIAAAALGLISVTAPVMWNRPAAAEDSPRLSVTRPSHLAATASATAHYAWIADTESDEVQAVTWRGLEQTTPWVTKAEDRAMALSTARGRLYVAIWNTSELVAVSTSTGESVGTVRVGLNPGAIAVSPDQKLAYVADSGTDTVTPVDLLDLKPLPPITVGKGPDAVGFSASGAMAYVANYDAGTVSVINTSTRKVVSTLHVGRGPTALAISGTQMIVLNQKSSSVTAVNLATNRAGRTEQVPDSPDAVAVGHSGARAWVACGGGILIPVRFGTLHLGKKMTLRSVHGSTLTSVVVGQKGYVYVSDYLPNDEPGDLWPVNTSTGQVGLPLDAGSGPDALVLTPDGSTLYVADWGAGAGKAGSTIQRIEVDAPQVAPPVKLRGAPEALALSPSGSSLYVAVGDEISVVSTQGNRVIRELSVGRSVGSEAVAPSGKELYLAVAGTAKVLTVNLPSGSEGSALTLSGIVCSLAVEPDGSFLVATTISSGSCASSAARLEIVPLQAGEKASSVVLGRGPVSLSLGDSGQYAAVALAASNATYTIDLATHRVIRRDNIGSSPSAVALSGASTRLFAFSSETGTLLKYDAVSAFAAFPVAELPSGDAGLGTDSTGSICVVTRYSDAAVDLILLSGAKIQIVSLPVGDGPGPVVFGQEGPLFLYPAQ